MPKRKYIKGRKRKNTRRYKRRRSYYRGPRSVMRVTGSVPFPKKAIMRFQYSDTVTLDPALGLVDTHVFAANDLYDCDVTGGGHQPIPFDQVVGVMYDHFTVIGSKITVQATTTTEANTNNFILGVALRDNSTVVTSRTTIREDGRSVWKVNTGRDQLTKITRKFSAKKFFAKNAIVGDSLYRGTNAGSPTEGAFYHVWASAIGSNNPYSMDVVVKIEFIAVLTEPKSIAGS